MEQNVNQPQTPNQGVNTTNVNPQATVPPMPTPAGADTPAAPAAVPPATTTPAGAAQFLDNQTVQTQVPEDVAKVLNEKATKLGLKYKDLEVEYLSCINKPELLKLSPEEKKRLAMLMMSAKFTSYANNPLVEYDFLVLGIMYNEGFKNSNIIARSIIPGKDASDLFTNGQLGIPTLITNFAEKFTEAENMHANTFFKANLTGSQIGAARREITSTSHTQYQQVNHPEVTQEMIDAWMNKNFPIQTLASLKKNMSKTIQLKKAGSKPIADKLDLRRVSVSITRTGTGNSKGGGKFYTYTVQDDSLTDDERMNTPVGDKKIYGGVSMTVPKPLFIEHNLDEASLIEALVVVRKKEPDDDGMMRTKLPYALDAVYIKPIVAVHKKVPQVQTPAGGAAPGAGKTQAFDLTAM